MRRESRCSRIAFQSARRKSICYTQGPIRIRSGRRSEGTLDSGLEISRERRKGKPRRGKHHHHRFRSTGGGGAFPGVTEDEAAGAREMRFQSSRRPQSRYTARFRGDSWSLVPLYRHDAASSAARGRLRKESGRQNCLGACVAPARCRNRMFSPSKLKPGEILLRRERFKASSKDVGAVHGGRHESGHPLPSFDSCLPAFQIHTTQFILGCGFALGFFRVPPSSSHLSVHKSASTSSQK